MSGNILIIYGAILPLDTADRFDGLGAARGAGVGVEHDDVGVLDATELRLHLGLEAVAAADRPDLRRAREIVGQDTDHGTGSSAVRFRRTSRTVKSMTWKRLVGRATPSQAMSKAVP